MTQGRASHKATLLSDGTVLVAGGVLGDDAGSCCMPQSSAELFDPRTGSWTATGSFVELRGGGTATLLPDGRVLVAGEINGGVVQNAETYDPAARSWSPAPNMIEPSHNLTATLLADGRVLYAGGSIDVRPYVFTGLARAAFYDPVTESWTRAPNMNARRGEGQVAIGLADGRVLVVGGLASMDGRDSPSVLSDPAAEVFDPDGGG
jgi:N-acetylneuraminic acid mutarotase